MDNVGDRTDRTPAVDRGSGALLVELVVADPAEAWDAAGFTVDDDRVQVGATTIRLVGAGSGHDPVGQRRGIITWTIAGLAGDPGTTGDLDGLPTSLVDAPAAHCARPDQEPPPEHANGVTGIDHVVVQTPDLDRTVAALGAVGLACRRIRETASYAGSPMRQAFFRLGPTVLEVVSDDSGAGLSATEDPATWFGLAVDVADLDLTKVLLGDGLGTVRPAVQAGRRIATLRSKALGLSVAVAVMDHHGDR